MFDRASCQHKKEGAPAWVTTFADLMSLLMCFFVLLLSFSEMDVSKYKEMAGSLKLAFGVQREIQVKEPPKGINVIAREFSPARPEPTQLNVIRQMTTNDLRINLDLGRERRRPVPTPKAKHKPDRDKGLKPGEQSDGLSEAQKKDLEQAKKLAAARLDEKLKAEQQLAQLQAQQKAGAVLDDASAEELLKAKMAAERQRKLEQSAKLISSALGKEIKAGSVDVETAGQKIIIRVREKASFGSGSAELKGAFRPLLARVATILKGSEGQIVVAGHTDNVPIYTERFRSNWELSAARAVSVAHEMMLATKIPSNRFLVQGFADTQPMANNDSAANRAKNRRVEIILQQGEDLEGGARSMGSEQTPAANATHLPDRNPQRQTVENNVRVPAGSVKASSGSLGIKAGGARKSAGGQAVSAAPEARKSAASGIRAAGSK
jgi:chemotaxis protein MotB